MLHEATAAGRLWTSHALAAGGRHACAMLCCCRAATTLAPTHDGRRRRLGNTNRSIAHGRQYDRSGAQSGAQRDQISSGGKDVLMRLRRRRWWCFRHTLGLVCCANRCSSSSSSSSSSSVGGNNRQTCLARPLRWRVRRLLPPTHSHPSWTGRSRRTRGLRLIRQTRCPPASGRRQAAAATQTAPRQT